MAVTGHQSQQVKILLNCWYRDLGPYYAWHFPISFPGPTPKLLPCKGSFRQNFLTTQVAFLHIFKGVYCEL